MYALSLKGWDSTPAQRQGRRSSFARLSLEPLEDRCALAGVSAAVAAPANNAGFHSAGSATLLALQNPFLTQATGTNSTTQGTTLGARFSLSQFAGPTMVPNSITLQGQGQNATPSFASPTGFPGRLMLPDTGVTSRVPTGYGPMTAPAGLFLPGGGGDLQTPVPPQEPPRITPAAIPLPVPINVDTSTDSDTDDEDFSSTMWTDWYE